ncbi:TyrR family helix-turn-helix domain protein [compost metagenome]
MIDCDNLELAGTALSTEQAEALDVTSLEAAVQGFEKSLLEKFYAAYPSTRQLAARLQTSHTAIGQRLRKYGIANRST